MLTSLAIVFYDFYSIVLEKKLAIIWLFEKIDRKFVVLSLCRNKFHCLLKRNLWSFRFKAKLIILIICFQNMGVDFLELHFFVAFSGGFIAQSPKQQFPLSF